MDEDPRERLRKLDSCAVSDAVDRLGESAGFAMDRFPVQTVPARLSGRVVTVLLGQPRSQTPPSHLCTAAISASGEGDVLVVAHDGREDCAGWGGTLSYAARAAGIAGTIVDGAVRDVDQAVELGYSVFARSATPLTARGRVQEHDWNCDVELGGRIVSPGDYVIADMSGIAFISRAAMPDVLQQAGTIAAAESELLKSIDKGIPVTEVMGLNYDELVARQ